MMTDAQQRKIEDAHDRQALEQRRLDRGDCPKCGSENFNRHHHRGSFLAPECTWFECADCGYKLDPN